MPDTNSPVEYTLQEVVWMSPGQLVPHPDNWKLHPAEQVEELRRSVEQFGWLKTVILNRRTGHLLNGEGRVQMALQAGLPQVPVWAIDVDEATERAILASFDQTGLLRETDALALLTLVGSLAEADEWPEELPPGFTLEHLQELQEAAYQAALPPAAADPPAAAGEPDSAAEPEPDLPAPPPSSVKLVYTAEEYAEFWGLVEELQERWGVQGVTPTVLLALDRVEAHEG